MRALTAGKSTPESMTPTPILISGGMTSPPRNGESTSTGMIRHISRPMVKMTSERLACSVILARTSETFI